MRPALIAVLSMVAAAVLLASCRSAGAPSVRIERATAKPALTRSPVPRPAAVAPAAAGIAGDGRRSPDRLSPPVVVPLAPPLPEPAVSDDGGLAAAIEQALGADAASVSVMVRRLTDGAGAEWRADQVHYAASLYKLEVLYEAFRQRSLGVLDFEQSLSVSEHYLAEDLGTFHLVPLEPDGSLKVENALHAMITLSDNTSATLLLDLLGHRNIDATMAALGLESSSVNTVELPTTAADMARLMAAIARGEGLDPAAAREMTALLLAQDTREGIPRGIPAGVSVGNKTGTWAGATHDVAVVFAPAGAYVIAVLSERGWTWDPIRRVSAAVYEYWQRPRQP